MADKSIWKEARLTGYHPRDVRNEAEILQEGKDHDQTGRPLHYLENYNPYDSESFVGLAADKSMFKYNDKIEIKEFPGVRFKVRDNGGGFNKKTGESAFDIPVLTRQKARELTNTIHWRRREDATQLLSSKRIHNEHGDIIVISLIFGLIMLRS